MLTLCEKWKLLSFKEHIEEYFFQYHNHGLRNFKGKNIRLNNLQLLQLADKHNLIKYCAAFLQQTTCLPFGNDYQKENFFKSSSAELTYEILKKVITTELYSNDIEVLVIFNFLDLILYENRVPDLSLTKRYENQTPSQVKMQTPTFNLMKNTEDKNEVIVKVEGYEIHINSIVLTEASPVFRAMLNSTFKEGHEKIVNLPGKKINGVLEFFSYLTKPKIIDGRYTSPSLLLRYLVTYKHIKILRLP